MRIAWLFNLDADEELRDPACYVRSQRMSTRIREYTPKLGALVQPGDIVLGEEGATVLGDAGPIDPGDDRHVGGDVHGDATVVDQVRHRNRPDAPLGAFLGQAWCPTPRAMHTLRAAGVALPRVPSVEVLRRVNSRAFLADWGVGLEGAVWLTSLAEFDTWLDAHAVSDARAHPTWVFKRAFGFAARGLQRFRPTEASTINRHWLSETLRRDGGVQIEPWVRRTRDFGLHGWITPDGASAIGRITVQSCTARGAWSESRPATSTDLDDAERTKLQHAVRRVAQALHEAGYFGPFGVDAYRWVDATGTTHLHPCSEVNARYSMGWATGMPQGRPRDASA